MPKLYFRYGAMGSSKTMNLLTTAHNYEQQNKKVIVIKPKIDVRFGEKIVASRTGIKREADIVSDDNYDLHQLKLDGISCVLVDEVQFMPVFQINQLREISMKVPVICYGLRTNYMSFLFPGSKRLMEIADSIEEVKTTCVDCNKKAIINAKLVYGNIIKEGDDKPVLGCEDLYQPMCWKCWKNDSIF